MGQPSGIDTLKIKSRGRIFIGGWINDMPSLNLKDIGCFFLGGYCPQILFVLVLILLIGSAFFLAYRSLVKQTQLNEMRS